MGAGAPRLRMIQHIVPDAVFSPIMLMRLQPPWPASYLTGLAALEYSAFLLSVTAHRTILPYLPSRKVRTWLS